MKQQQQEEQAAAEEQEEEEEEEQEEETEQEEQQQQQEEQQQEQQQQEEQQQQQQQQEEQQQEQQQQEEEEEEEEGIEEGSLTERLSVEEKQGHQDGQADAEQVTDDADAEEEDELLTAPSFPPELASLLNHCWHADPEERPNFEQVLSMVDRLQIAHQEELEWRLDERWQGPSNRTDHTDRTDRTDRTLQGVGRDRGQHPRFRGQGADSDRQAPVLRQNQSAASTTSRMQSVIRGMGFGGISRRSTDGGIGRPNPSNMRGGSNVPPVLGGELTSGWTSRSGTSKSGTSKSGGWSSRSGTSKSDSGRASESSVSSSGSLNSIDKDTRKQAKGVSSLLMPLMDNDRWK
jgi:hypothetical protein